MKIKTLLLSALASFSCLAGCTTQDLIESNTSKKDETPEGWLKYDDFEVKVDASYSIVRVPNQFDDDFNKPAIRIPVTVKNISSSTTSISFLEVKVFTPEGTEARNYYSYFDDSLFNAGELLSGASYTKYLYASYTSDGDYSIVFGLWKEEARATINVVGGEAVLPIKTEYNADEKFKFQNLEITFLSDYSLVAHPNQFADYYTYQIIKQPVEIKNLDTSPDYLKSFKIFDPSGVEIPSQWIYFDDSIDRYSKSVNAGGTLTGPIYFPYIEAGQYSIVFSYLNNVVTVKLNYSNEN